MARRRVRMRVVGAALAVVAFAVAALSLLGPYYLHVVNVTIINVLLALGLNFVLGFGGQISLAQAAFFGIGAYTFSVLELRGVAAVMAAPAGIVAAIAAGLGLGWPCLRLRGHYLALATLGFALIIEELLINVAVLTGGANGLTGIPGVGLTQDDRGMFLVLLGLTILGIALSVWFERSPLGLRARAMRDNELAADAIGTDITRMRLLLFATSAGYAGVAGVLYASLLGYVSPDVFAWLTTFNYLVMVVVGGMGTTLGPVLGAGLYTLVPEWFRFLQQAYFAAFGLVVIVVITTMPGGMNWVIRAGLRWRPSGSLGRLVMRMRSSEGLPKQRTGHP